MKKGIDEKILPIIDVQAEKDAQKAITEAVKEGNIDERQALLMIAEGDINGGLDLLIKSASKTAAENIKQWRRIGRLAYEVDVKKALNAYERVIKIGSTEPWDAIYLGRLYIRSGQSYEAQRIYFRALAHLPEVDSRNKSVLWNEIGDVQKAQGDLAGALKSYQASMGIRERLAKSDPGNAGWQRDLSVSYEKIGDVQKAQGDLAGALKSYQASMGIRERLAKSDPGNAGWQRDLSVSYEKIGDIHEANGKILLAIKAYEKSLPLAKDLANRCPDHPLFQSDIAITKNRLSQLKSKL